VADAAFFEKTQILGLLGLGERGTSQARKLLRASPPALDAELAQGRPMNQSGSRPASDRRDAGFSEVVLRSRG